MDNYIPMSECIFRRVYQIDSRNLSYGVYDGKGGFIGIRTKFNNKYLFTEFHYEASKDFGTVNGHVDISINVPENIPICEHLRIIDSKTGREIYFSKGWSYKDTDERTVSILPVIVENKELFEFLEMVEVEDKHCIPLLGISF